jgi:hypothetical protein
VERDEEKGRGRDDEGKEGKKPEDPSGLPAFAANRVSRIR